MVACNRLLIILLFFKNEYLVSTKWKNRNINIFLFLSLTGGLPSLGFI